MLLILIWQRVSDDFLSPARKIWFTFQFPSKMLLNLNRRLSALHRCSPFKMSLVYGDKRIRVRFLPEMGRGTGNI